MLKKDSFFSVIQTTSLKQYLTTFFGILVNGFLGALFYILLARLLGPEDFGLLAVAVAVLTLVTDLASLGTDSSLVRFVGQNLISDRITAYRYLKLILEIRLISGLVVTIVGFWIGPIIALSFFHKASLVLPLQLAFLGVAGAQLFAFSLAAFQALQKFKNWSVIQISTNALRLGLIILLLTLSWLNLFSTLAIYIILPILGFVASLFFLPTGFLKAKNENLVLDDLFHYSKWIALSVMIAAFSSRLDTFISGRLLSAAEVGFYTAASQLVLIIPQIMRAMDTVIAPKMTQLQSKKELKDYLRKTEILVLCLCGLGLLSSPIVLFLIPMLYGPAYAESVPLLFLILLLANLVFLISVPIHSAINYFFGKPQLFIYTSVVNLLIISILGWWLISQFGVVGAAITVLIGMSFNLIIPAIWLVINFAKD